MNTIIKNYNLLVNNYQKIEVSSSEDVIHDKRVILRQIFPILAAFKMKPTKIKNGEKAFKLFGKLRDIQVQITKLKSIDHTPEIIEYLAFLKELELKIEEKVSKFCRKKELEFPCIKRKVKVNKSSAHKKADKSLNKLIEKIESRSIDDAEDIQRIRIAFKKFRYKVEILSYFENIHEAKLEMMKVYQDELGEINDYEVLIKGINKYFKKRKLDDEDLTEIFEIDQNSLIEKFDNHVQLFISVCKDVIDLENNVERIKDEDSLTEISNLKEDKQEQTEASFTEDLAGENTDSINVKMVKSVNPTSDNQF